MYTQQLYNSELEREPILSIWRKINDREHEDADTVPSVDTAETTEEQTLRENN